MIDPKNLILSFFSLKKPITTKVESMDSIFMEFSLFLNFAFYNSSTDHNEQPSGAYIFRPEGSQKTPIIFDQFESFQSDLVNEYWYSSSSVNWVSLVLRDYLEYPYSEIDWLAGPLPAGGSGIELVMNYRFQYGIANETNSATDEKVSVNGWIKNRYTS